MRGIRSGQCSGAVGHFAASELYGLRFNPELGLTVFSCMSFTCLQFRRFLLPPKIDMCIICGNLSISMNECFSVIEIPLSPAALLPKKDLDLLQPSSSG